MLTSSHLRFRNGDQMPPVAIGTWQLPPDDAYSLVKHAIKIGYRMIDCAAFYANEKAIGSALAECIHEGIVKRKDIFIVSKLWNDMHDPSDVSNAFNSSLRDLQLDYIDLYLIHWPIAFKKGVKFPTDSAECISLDEIPLCTTWSKMEELVDTGRCKHIGVSNFCLSKLSAILRNARIRPEANQIERHPYLQQPSLFDFCQREQILVTAYGALGSGRTQDAPVFLQDPTINNIARERKCKPAQVLLKWQIQTGAAVNIRTTKLDHMKEGLNSLDVMLTEEDMGKIRYLDCGRRYFTGSFAFVEASPYNESNIFDDVDDDLVMETY